MCGAHEHPAISSTRGVARVASPAAPGDAHGRAVLDSTADAPPPTRAMLSCLLRVWVRTSAVESYTGSSYPVIDAYRKCIDACRLRVARTCGRSSHWTSCGMAASDSGAITHEAFAFLTSSKKSSKTPTHSLFCWQNQDHFDLQFPLGARSGAGEQAKYESALTSLTSWH